MACAVGYLLLLLTATASSVPQTNQATHFSPMGFLPNNDLTESFSYFDTELLKQVTSHEKEGNILISPISIKSTLAMILEGSDAQGLGAIELRTALRLTNDQSIVRKQLKKLISDLNNPKNHVTIELANRVFLNDKLTPLKSYVDTLSRYYNSNVTKVNFSSPSIAADGINYWVNQQTHGMIPTLVTADILNGDTTILLANALYFKGTWEKSFDELGTRNRCFYLSSGECFMTPMMDTVDFYKYADLDEIDAQAMELPYTGGNFTMLIVLPNKRSGIQQLVRDITHNPVPKIVSKLELTEILVALPRFQIEYTNDMVADLRHLEVNEIFGPKASLKGIVPDVPVHVSNVLHKTRIEVNEKGTVAAAATGAVVIPLMGGTKPSVRADHPFLFFVRHVPTGTILFEGRVSVPERAIEQPKTSTRYALNKKISVNDLGSVQNPQSASSVQNVQIQQQYLPPQTTYAHNYQAPPVPYPVYSEAERLNYPDQQQRHTNW